MKDDTKKLFNDSLDKPDTNEYEYIDKFLMSAERTRVFFNSSPLAILIINKKGIFIDANRKLYDWLKYKPNEIIGKNFNQIPFLPDESKRTIINNFNKRMNGEKVPPYEVEIIHKNGMKKYGEIYGNLLRDDVRKISLDIIMVNDITEKKKAYENLKDNEKRYRVLFENTTNLVQSVDADGNFVDVNPAWLKTLEYSKDEIKNLNFINILRKDQVQHCVDVFGRVKKGEEMRGVKTVFISKSGKEIYVKGNIKGLFRQRLFNATFGIFKPVSNLN